MKTYKIITIHSNGTLSDQYKNGEKLINEYVKDGWIVEHVTHTGVKGELAFTLSKDNLPKMLND